MQCLYSRKEEMHYQINCTTQLCLLVMYGQFATLLRGGTAEPCRRLKTTAAAASAIITIVLPYTMLQCNMIGHA